MPCDPEIAIAHRELRFRAQALHPRLQLDHIVEPDTETLRVRIREPTGTERDEVYARQLALEPQFGDHQRRTNRTIPVPELQRV